MITEKQKEELKSLTEKVETYCNENGISILMVAAVTEEHPTGLEQICSSVVQGKGKHIIGSLIGAIKAESRLSSLLAVTFTEADQVSTNIIPMDNINVN